MQDKLKENTLRHVVIKLTKIKNKDKNLKARREKQTTYNRNPTRLPADFSTEPLQARREWHNIFQVIKRKNFQPRTLDPARFSIRFDGRNQKLSRQAEVKRIQHH